MWQLLLTSPVVQVDERLFLNTWGNNTADYDNFLSNNSNVIMSWTSIGGGVSHAAAIRSDGKLFTWGFNTQGQLGDGTTVAKSSPVQIGSDSWTAVAAGLNYTVGLKSGGTLFSWGVNTSGVLGDGTTVNKSSPVQIGSSSWTAVYTGGAATHVAAIRNDGTLWMWGEAGSGQLGQLTEPPASWTQICGGDSWTMALRSDGALFTWGYNNYGQLGAGNTTNRSSPVQLGASSWTAIAAGGEHALAIRIDGRLFSWGRNSEGQLGSNTTTNRSSPVQVGSSSWTAVAAAQYSSFGIRSGGTLYSWGWNYYYTLGDGTATTVSSPIQIGGNTSWNILAAGTQFAGAITNDNKLYTWGYNQNGQLGQGDHTVYSWTALAGTNGNTILAIRNDGLLFAWGYNNLGQVGNNSSESQIRSPVQIGSSIWTAVATGSTSSFAIRSDGMLFAWGRNTEGQLGINDLTNRSSPVQVGSSSWTAVRSGDYHTLAIRSDGLLFAMGNNSDGQLGDLTRTSRSSPVQVLSSTASWAAIAAAGGDQTRCSYAIDINGLLYSWGQGNNNYMLGQVTNIYSWTTISSSLSHTVAIRSDGMLFTWGYAAYGQLGNEFTGENRYSPVQIGSSSWTAVSAGPAMTLAIRSGGTLFSWGYGFAGALGDGTAVSKSSPVQIGSRSWIAIATNSENSPVTDQFCLAIRDDNLLFSWGYNAYGNLGDGTINNRSSPVQIGSSSWIAIAAGHWHSAAIDSNNKLFAWGLNNLGQLGDGTTTNRSSPVQVGSSSWTAITAGSSYTVGIRQNSLLYSWGDNTDGINGNDNNTGLQSWTQVCYTGYNAIAIRSDGMLFTWGSNIYGEGGTNSTRVSTSVLNNSPTQIGSSSWTMVAGMQMTMYAIRSGGTLFSWGLNDSGQMGDNTTVNKSSPTQIGSNSWTFISCSGGTPNWSFYGHLGAIDSNGTLFMWGLNDYGQLGDGTSINRSSPVQIGSDSWTLVATVGAARGTGAIRSDGKLFTWGAAGATLGQGPSATTNKSSPVQVGSSSWTALNGGYDHFLAIRSGGTLFSWGGNYYGQLGDGDIGYGGAKDSPVQIGSSSWTVVWAGIQKSFAIRSDGTLWGWGDGALGQLGNGNFFNNWNPSPIQIGSETYWDKLNLGGVGGIWLGNDQAPRAVHAGAITTNGTLYTWGYNVESGYLTPYVSGILGNNSTLSYNSPVTVGNNGLQSSSPIQIGSSSWSVINSRYGKNYGKYINGDLFVWGLDNSNLAILGPGITGTRSSPVAFSAGYSSVVYSGASSGAFKSDGTLYMWGYNTAGMLGTLQISTSFNSSPTLLGGQADWEDKSSPVVVNQFNGWGSSSFTIVNAGRSAVAAIRAGGTLFTWGRNTYGQLGNSSTIQPSSPVQIGSSSWTLVNPGYEFMNGILSNGKIYAWGYSGNQRLGTTTGNISSPVLIQGVGSSSWTALTANDNGGAGILQNGLLYTWGWNGYGTLGTSNYADTAVPTAIQNGFNILYYSVPTPVGSSSWTAVSFGEYNGQGIMSNGLLFSWGYGALGQNGQGNTTDYDSPVQIGSSSWSAVGTLRNTSLAIRSDGQLFAWGRNAEGQVGDETNTQRNSPVQVGNSYFTWNFTGKGPMSYSSYAIRNDSTLQVWGYNGVGQLGNSTTLNTNSPINIGQKPALTTDRSSPVQIGYYQSWIAVATGSAHTLALRSDYRLFVWGLNSSGQLGDGTTVNKSSPIMLSNTASVSWTAVAAGAAHSLIIKSDATLFTFGNNIVGQLGLGDATTVNNRNSPNQVGGSWLAIGAGSSHSVGIKSDGTLYTWGLNSSGQMGDATTVNKSSPVLISYLTGLSSNASIAQNGGAYTLIEQNNYAVKLWGIGASGLLGDRTTVNKSQPQVLTAQFLYVPIREGTQSWTNIAAGTSHIAAVRGDGLLFTWGFNNVGQLGTGDTIYRSSPTQIGASSWTMVSAGPSTTSAIRSDGYLFTWGLATSGFLGDSTTINKSSPVQIGSSSWTAVSLGASHAMAIRSGGTLFSWGLGTSGQLGTNAATTTSSPVLLVAAYASSSWTAVKAGINSSYAIRSGGTLFSWGINSAAGQLGINQTVNKSSPVQIGSSSWTAVAAGQSYGMAISSDGVLYSWGLNNVGQLGNNNTTNQLVPVQIGSSSWIAVSAGFSHSAAVSSDYNLYTWGLNTLGQLGDGTTTNKSSPVLISKSTGYNISQWRDIEMNNYSANSFGLTRQ